MERKDIKVKVVDIWNPYDDREDCRKEEGRLLTNMVNSLMEEENDYELLSVQFSYLGFYTTRIFMVLKKRS